jgi:hypothetical protein
LLTIFKLNYIYIINTNVKIINVGCVGCVALF